MIFSESRLRTSLPVFNCVSNLAYDWHTAYVAIKNGNTDEHK
jgi:hypothetical protein